MTLLSLPTVYREPWHAITLGQQVLTIMSERLPIERIQLRPHCSIGVAMFYGDLTAEQLYSRAISAAFTARHKGKNQIQFFDPQQMEAAQKRLTEESDILCTGKSSVCYLVTATGRDDQR